VEEFGFKERQFAPDGKTVPMDLNWRVGRSPKDDLPMMANPMANQKGSVTDKFVQSRLTIFADGTVSGGVTV
jgi:hypothetical protein